jgi:AbrB family looped-hinge helix DNA binding protein
LAQFIKVAEMEIRTQITSGGRIVLPAKLRKALEIQIGDEIVMRLESGSIRLIPLRQAVNLAQKAVRQYVPKGTSLVDELIRARREEASSE